MVGSEPGSLAGEEAVVNPAVQLVHVDRVDPVLDAPAPLARGVALEHHMYD
ncbi:MAG: hypothetical protein ABSG03_31160 [Bryobacteraceae bacterium]